MNARRLSVKPVLLFRSVLFEFRYFQDLAKNISVTVVRSVADPVNGGRSLTLTSKFLRGQSNEIFDFQGFFIDRTHAPKELTNGLNISIFLRFHGVILFLSLDSPGKIHL